MNENPEENGILQWHPAFYAGLQIELAEDRANLIFENEHQLSTRPMEIDILIIKKERDVPVRKNIGQIFRKYNIIEYKSPSDYLNVDDFYKVYGYACFYKADTGGTDVIPAEELTITLVCCRYPRKLIKYLQEKRKYIVKKAGDGIFYIDGDHIPIQLIVTSQLLETENLWLKNLTNKIEKTASARKLVQEYGKHKNDHLYQAVMDIIVRANTEQFQEVGSMCDALMELMKDKFDEARKEAVQQGLEQGLEQGLAQGLEQGRQQGLERGLEQGVDILIETCRELGMSREFTAKKIAEKYGFSEDRIKTSMEKNWPDLLQER